MAVRTTMVELIGRVRELIADPAGAGQAFSNGAIQNELDRHRDVVRYAQLAPDWAAVAVTGNYLEYSADYGDWEGGAKLYDAAQHEITPAEADLLTGRWTLSANVYPPLYIVGQSYDVYRVAVALLRQWTLREPGRAAAFAVAIKLYESQARLKSIQLTRSDVNASEWVSNDSLPLPPGARSR